MSHIIGNFFKALFITFLGGLFSSILLIGFNFSKYPVESYLQVFWPTAMFFALLGFIGTYTVFAFKKEDPDGKYAQKLSTMRGFWMALSIIVFAMAVKGSYEYIVSPLRENANIRGVKLKKDIKRPETCPGGSCALRYEKSIPRHNKNW